MIGWCSAQLASGEETHPVQGWLYGVLVQKQSRIVQVEQMIIIERIYYYNGWSITMIYTIIIITPGYPHYFLLILLCIIVPNIDYLVCHSWSQGNGNLESVPHFQTKLRVVESKWGWFQTNYLFEDQYLFGVFHKWGYPKMDGLWWFIRENPIVVDDLGEPPPIYGNTHFHVHQGTRVLIHTEISQISLASSCFFFLPSGIIKHSLLASPSFIDRCVRWKNLHFHRGVPSHDEGYTWYMVVSWVIGVPPVIIHF